MVDDSHVMVAAGTGAEMILAPEIAAFAERYGFVFHAHAKGLRIARRVWKRPSTASSAASYSERTSVTGQI